MEPPSPMAKSNVDFKLFSRQNPTATIEIIQFNQKELVTCDWVLWADQMLKEFCFFILDVCQIDDDNHGKQSLDATDPTLTTTGKKAIVLTTKKQVVLIQSCLSDLLYAIHCLGLWCAKKTAHMYICEFSRLLENVGPISNLIGAALTTLNCFYNRLEKFMMYYGTIKEDVSEDQAIFESSSKQLKTLLEYIKESIPKSGTSCPMCIIHVRRRVIAKVIALWLDRISKTYDEYSFISPNYIVGSSRKHRNRMAVDNFDLHHEASVRDFRFGNCNILVVSAISERSTVMPRCNLVISLDIPTRFSDYIQAKGNCRFETSKYVIMVNPLLDIDADEILLKFINMEKILNSLHRNVSLEQEETQIMEAIEEQFPPYPNSQCKNPATIWRSLGIINKYCTKLPSDSFTRLSPDWTFKEIKDGDKIEHYCELRLPINSPVRQTIVGPKAATKNIAMRLAAYTATKLLHKSDELDDNMMPITKESMKLINPLTAGQHQKDPNQGKIVRTKGGSGTKQAMGSTKHRQYYKKRIAEVFSGPLIEPGINCYLYEFKMVLTCPLPEEQNRRGRRIIDPSETNRNYAIVCTGKLPKICSFPVFTRSGEVLISIKLVKENFKLDAKQISNLRTFHEYTFSRVLRLEKYPTLYDPNNSPFKVLLAPVIDNDSSNAAIDWQFVDKIVNSDKDSYIPDEEERKKFTFNHDDYEDAVVIPWYRLTDRQQFAYYVAEIRTDLNPGSPFPDEDSGFKTFIEYYKSKYNIHILNKDQPVLDVDHTSARLNLLTPRYVNRKGRTLPSSAAKTRKESRENLVQKQLLIPELCTIHPFPASFWRKAVCLPCIFYRLNSLFLAEELRRKVAEETKIGFIEPPEDFEWSTLDFGWSSNSSQQGDSSKSSDNFHDDIKALTFNKFMKLSKDRADCDGSFEESDSSWSNNLSDDDDANSTDDDMLNNHISFKEWKDSKAKNRPLIRELFLPYIKMNQGLQASDVESLNKVMQIYISTTSSTGNKVSKDELMQQQPIELKQSLDKTKVIESSEQYIIDIFNNISEMKISITPQETRDSLLRWYGILIKLTDSFEKTLTDEPDLFEDNGIELVTVDDSFIGIDLEVQPTFGELLPNRDSNCSYSNEDWKRIRFDPTLSEIKSNGPGLSVILQALTMSNASDGINLERLETVGDSFLKYSITAYLYCMYPSMHEGKLSYLRSTEISNANLYSLGKSKCLGEIMSATKFEPNDNWLAPGYSVAESSPETKNANNKRREIDKALAEVPYDLLLQHSIPDKSIADCVEALIGAYLTASGSRAALLFMQWLGLRVVPPHFDLKNDLKLSQDNSITESSNAVWRWLDTPPSPLICLPPYYDDKCSDLKVGISEEEFKINASKELERLYLSNQLEEFEKDIGYSFNDKAYLIQAFTHNSYFENHVTDCHQRLEFLGDALLDYLITRYLFEDPRCHSPGTLTDLRSALVNNTFFASLAVKYKFHNYLLYISDELFSVIDGFVKKFKSDNKNAITKGSTLLITEGESEYAEDIEVPKALGDVFESVAGAIYLDSGMSLDQVWRVYFKMMKPEIEYFSSNVPKSPIRELLESMPQNVRFSPSELAPDRKHRVIAEVFGLGRFIGVGRNKHSAKSTAAKRALRMLALKRKEAERNRLSTAPDNLVKQEVESNA